MKIKKITPELVVADVNKSVEFYRNVFGFETKASVPDKGPLAWASLTLSDSKLDLMLERREAVKEELGESKSGGILYIEVDDTGAWHDKIKELTKIEKPLHRTFYGACEFAIKDPDGYWIVLAGD